MLFKNSENLKTVHISIEKELLCISATTTSKKNVKTRGRKNEKCFGCCTGGSNESVTNSRWCGACLQKSNAAQYTFHLNEIVLKKFIQIFFIHARIHFNELRFRLNFIACKSNAVKCASVFVCSCEWGRFLLSHNNITLYSTSSCMLYVNDQIIFFRIPVIMCCEWEIKDDNMHTHTHVAPSVIFFGG